MAKCEWWCARYSIISGKFAWADAQIKNDRYGKFITADQSRYHDWWPVQMYPTKEDLPIHRYEIPIWTTEQLRGKT